MALPLTVGDINRFIKRTGTGRAEQPVSGYRGLRVRVRNSRGTYVLRYRDATGALRSSVLGIVGIAAHADVITAWKAAQADREKGIDPLTAKAEKKQAEADLVSSIKAATMAEKPLTVKQLVRAYLDSPAAAELKSIGQKMYRLERTLERIGELPAATLSRTDVLHFVEVCDRNGPAERNKQVAALKSVWKWGMHQKAYAELLEINPWLFVQPNAARARTRALGESELKRFMGWLPACVEPQRTILQLLLLTGARIDNICGARVEWLEGNRLTVPADVFKTKVPFTIILSRQALALIERQRAGRTSGWLFPSTMGGAYSHTRQNTVRMHLARCGIPDFNPHDLRRVLKTWAAEIGIDDAVSERVLGHGPKGIQAVYNQAKYNIPAAAAWQRWADHLETLTSTDNVIAIRA